jgi:hypothetical protein
MSNHPSITLTSPIKRERYLDVAKFLRAVRVSAAKLP